MNKKPSRLILWERARSSVRGNWPFQLLKADLTGGLVRSLSMLTLGLIILGSSCKIYSFRNVSIPKEIKTIRIGYLENKARFVDPNLSPQLTNALTQKINNQTNLTPVISDQPDYDVSGYVSDYSITTSGVANQTAATNRLTVTVHIVLKNRLNDQKIGTPDFEADVTRNFDFSASLTITDAEAQLTSTIVSNMTDEIFNRLFSNW
jgi:Lipopolysaccharide-assembly